MAINFLIDLRSLIPTASDWEGQYEFWETDWGPPIAKSDEPESKKSALQNAL